MRIVARLAGAWPLIAASMTFAWQAHAQPQPLDSKAPNSTTKEAPTAGANASGAETSGSGTVESSADAGTPAGNDSSGAGSKDGSVPPKTTSESQAPPNEVQPSPPSTTTEPANATRSGLFEQSVAESSSAGNGERTEGAAQTSGFDLNGYVRGDVFVGKVPDTHEGMIKAGYGELALKFRVQKERFGDAYAEARFRDGLQGETRTLFVDLREAYVNGYFGPLDLRFGKQIIVWGRADAFNPANNLTPIDLRIRSPIEDDRRVGNLGARAFLNFSPVRLEGVWMPLYSASELPYFKLPEYVAFGDPVYPSPNLKNGLGAGRLHLELPAVEMSVSYLHGYAPLPGLTLESYTLGVNPPVILVSRTAYDQDVAGFDFATSLGDFLGLRGEAAYRRPVDYQHRLYAPRPDLQYVLGVDHSFGPLSVIAQYIGRYVFDWRRENGPANPIDPTALVTFTPPVPATITQQINDTIAGQLAQKNQILFQQTARVQHLASVRVEWLTLHDTLSLSALCLVNFTTKEWLAYPKLTYQLSDRMSTALGAEIYMGPEGTMLGLIKEELSAGYAELKFAF